MSSGVVHTNISWLIVAFSLAYIGGMYLNDAFDQKIDAIERPERPIPSGQISANWVFYIGFALLALCILMIALFAHYYHAPLYPSLISATALAGAIVLYNVWHKNNPLSPLIMGLCRVLVYITTAFALLYIVMDKETGLALEPTQTAELSRELYIGVGCLLAYLIGLTYTAKQEYTGRVGNFWPLALLLAPVVFGVFHAVQAPLVWVPTMLLSACLVLAVYFVLRKAPGDIPKAVTLMIAGIALVDAIFITVMANFTVMVVAIVCFALTLLLQRFIAGT